MDSVIECYSGHTYAERPRAFLWHNQKFEIETIESEWRSPEGKHFRVKIKDGRIFELIYDEANDKWQICEI